MPEPIESDKDEGEDWALPQLAPRTTIGQFGAVLSGWKFKADSLTIIMDVSGDEARLVAANLPRLTGLLTVVLTAEATQLAFWA